MDKRTCVNVGCGLSYVEGWLNFDYEPASTAVARANLLGRLPLSADVADVVYSSHFLEHIPRARVEGFLAECFRVLKPGGRIRLVLPDLDEICREYLRQREAGCHARADFVVLELLDQCVRTRSGGDLGRYLGALVASDRQEMRDYVADRTGELLREPAAAVAEGRQRNHLHGMLKIRERLERLYCKAVIALLPSAFSEQNVSFAGVGERHAWVYDFHTLSVLLERAGFVSIERMGCDQTKIPEFPIFPLDMTKSGRPRKGLESMYVEAGK